MSVNGFDFVLFPLSVSDFMGTVEYLTIVTPFLSGAEQRIARWEDGRTKFDAALGVRSLKDLRTLVDFHGRRKGKARGFMVRSLLNFEVTGATTGEGVIGEGDGAETVFQLKRTTTDYTEVDPVYGTTGNTESKTIYLPEYGTVKIYLDGVLQVAGYTVNYKNGQITFAVAPALGVIIEWTGQFFIPVRFIEDEVPVDEFTALMRWDEVQSEMLIDKAAGKMPNVAMIETRDLVDAA